MQGKEEVWKAEVDPVSGVLHWRLLRLDRDVGTANIAQTVGPVRRDGTNAGGGESENDTRVGWGYRGCILETGSRQPLFG